VHWDREVPKPIAINQSINHSSQMLTMKSFSLSELVSGSDDTPVLMSPCCQLSVPKKTAQFILKSVLKSSDDGMLRWALPGFCTFAIISSHKKRSFWWTNLLISWSKSVGSYLLGNKLKNIPSHCKWSVKVGGSTVFWNVGRFIPDCILSHPRRRQTS